MTFDDARGGRVGNRGTRLVLPGSPILALSVAEKFDQYIFCDEEPQNIADLRKRVAAQFPGQACEYIVGDANERVREITAKIPTNNWDSHKVLTLASPSAEHLIDRHAKAS